MAGPLNYGAHGVFPPRREAGTLVFNQRRSLRALLSASQEKRATNLLEVSRKCFYLLHYNCVEAAGLEGNRSWPRPLLTHSSSVKINRHGQGRLSSLPSMNLGVTGRAKCSPVYDQCFLSGDLWLAGCPHELVVKFSAWDLAGKWKITLDVGLHLNLEKSPVGQGPLPIVPSLGVHRFL